MSRKILVIDDDGIITKLVGGLLKREGYITEVANSGQEAVEKAKNKTFDLIVADIRMPGMDGLQTITKIRHYLKKESEIDIPVIFITGYADSDAHIKAKKYGEVIFKPFDMKEFLALVSKKIRR